MNKEKVSRFGVSMEPSLLAKFDRLIEEKGYPNRSEAVRDLVRNHLVEKEWEGLRGEVVGAVTLVYDHHVRDLSDKLTALQHDYYKNIITTNHVHLDHHNCLEVIVLKGSSREIKTLSEKLISTKGVKHGKLTMTSTGKDL